MWTSPRRVLVKQKVLESCWRRHLGSETSGWEYRTPPRLSEVGNMEVYRKWTKSYAAPVCIYEKGDISLKYMWNFKTHCILQMVKVTHLPGPRGPAVGFWQLGELLPTWLELPDPEEGLKIDVAFTSYLKRAIKHLGMRSAGCGFSLPSGSGVSWLRVVLDLFNINQSVIGIVT